jgi:hypothetical protein
VLREQLFQSVRTEGDTVARGKRERTFQDDVKKLIEASGQRFLKLLKATITPQEEKQQSEG